MTKEEKALRLCIGDAARRELGVQASTSPYGPMIRQIEKDLLRAYELGVNTTPRWLDGYRSRGHVLFKRGSHGDLAYIVVADRYAFMKYGVGMRGEHASMSIGDSLLPGPWWDDIAEAAKELSNEVHKGEIALAEARAKHARDVAEAQAFLVSRTKFQDP